MAEPFTVSAHASKANIESWARAQDSNTRIASKLGQDGQTVLYAKKMGFFEAIFHRTTKQERVQTARTFVDRALKSDPPTFTPSIRGGGQRMLSLGKLSDLPETFLQSDKFKAELANLGTALTSGSLNEMHTCGNKLADLISQELRKQPFSQQMRFALADTNTLAKELLSSALKTAQEHLQKTGGDALSLAPDRLDALGPRAKVLTDCIDQVMANLSDCALSDKEIRINGNSYVRDEKPLGSGAFGQTYIFRAATPGNLTKGEPETLVVKCPSDDMGLGFQEAKVLGPLREARGLVNGGGTGGSEFSGNVAKFHSAIRGTDGSVLVVMRLEEGGSASGVFDKALQRLGSLDPSTKITDQQYEDMTLTLMKDAIQGAARFHEGGQLAHFDLKIDNVLVSKDGIGRVADPGASRGLGDINELDSPNDANHFTPISYTAPEKFVGGKSTSASDVYTLGMTLLEALTKSGPLSLAKNLRSHPLFTSADTDFSLRGLQKRAIEWAKNPNAVMLKPESVPLGSLLEKYADLINQMTSPSPGKRPTLEQVLAHPLFNQPGQGTNEIRELIKSLAPKPPAPQQAEQADDEININYGYVGDMQLGNDALRSVGEQRDDSILAYGRRSQQPDLSASMESPELNSQQATTPNVNYVSVTNPPTPESIGSPNTVSPLRTDENGYAPVRTDDPAVAYDGQLETKDDVKDGKSEIPDRTPPRSQANQYL